METLSGCSRGTDIAVKPSAQRGIAITPSTTARDRRIQNVASVGVLVGDSGASFLHTGNPVSKGRALQALHLFQLHGKHEDITLG